MTRILSEILKAEEPHFQLQLRQLEQLSGHGNADIKLSVEVTQQTKAKVQQLGLDANDTTAEELYHMLLERVRADDARLERALRTRAATHVSAEAKLSDGMVHALSEDAAAVRGFSLKSSAARRLIKQVVPKRVQKSLNYRSIDAMIRNEQPAALIAAARSLESGAWRRTWLDAYKKLKPADFEDKAASIVYLQTERWQELARKMHADLAHTVVALPEFGAVVLLPLPAERPKGTVMATTVIALRELNMIAAASSYLRASQMQADFPSRVRAIASESVTLTTPLLRQSIPWHVVHQHFSRLQTEVNEDIFGPYVQRSDFYWQNVEARLTTLCPAMAFWQGTSFLSFLEQGKTVSLNLLDSAINSCNSFAYQFRHTADAEQALWHELTLRYMHRDSLETAIANILQPQFAKEIATN